MAVLTRRELTTLLEAMAPGQELAFQYSPTFGSCFAIVQANPDASGKRYNMYYGPRLDVARDSKPLWRANRVAKVAEWLSESNPSMVEYMPKLAQAV